MFEAIKKLYYAGGTDLDDLDADTPVLVTYTGTAGTLDGDTYENNVINIQLSSTSAMTYAISNPHPGTMYNIEATGTGVNDRVLTLTGGTVNATGNNTVTMNAQSEGINLMCISATRYVVVTNNGVAVLSTV